MSADREEAHAAIDALGLTLLQRLNVWEQGRVLLVSSARSGEGKSFVASRLAAGVSRLLDGPVALIDANAANPSVGSDLRVGAVDGGLFDCLAQQKLIQDRAIETRVPGLWVMPTERARDHSSMLYRLAAMKAVLEDLRENFTLTIVDAGPLRQAGCLPLLADGTLLVVDASRTRRDIVAGALDTPYVDRKRVLGVVLNRRPQYVPRWLYRSLL